MGKIEILMFRFAAGSQVSAISHELFELFLITDSEGIERERKYSDAAFLFFSLSAGQCKDLHLWQKLNATVIVPGSETNTSFKRWLALSQKRYDKFAAQHKCTVVLSSLTIFCEAALEQYLLWICLTNTSELK